MKKKETIIIIICTAILLLILLLNKEQKINDLLISEKYLDSIINGREENNNLKINKMYLNDSVLIIDQKKNNIYNTTEDITKRKNYSIRYKTDNKTDKIKILDNGSIRIIIYNDTYYHIYYFTELINPIINIDCNEITDKNEMANVLIIDNNKKNTHRNIKTMSNIKYTENKDYLLSFKLESIGNNRRKREISLFGMDIADQFIIERENNLNKKNLIELFINSEYQGEYTINPFRRGE